MNVPPLLTFPARPIQGGRLELAPPKRGLWYAEPKLNGWRALIQTPSGTLWNRHGSLLIGDRLRGAFDIQWTNEQRGARTLRGYARSFGDDEDARFLRDERPFLDHQIHAVLPRIDE